MFGFGKMKLGGFTSGLTSMVKQGAEMANKAADQAAGQLNQALDTATGKKIFP